METMWKEIETTSNVLEKLSSEHIESFLNNLRQDVVHPKPELSSMVQSLGSMLNEDRRRLVSLSKKIEGSIETVSDDPPNKAERRRRGMNVDFEYDEYRCSLCGETKSENYKEW